MEAGAGAVTPKAVPSKGAAPKKQESSSSEDSSSDSEEEQPAKVEEESPFRTPYLSIFLCLKRHKSVVRNV